jgi:N-acetylmuramic acid 6-phosphate etherase
VSTSGDPAGTGRAPLDGPAATTEARNPRSEDLDQLDVLELLEVMNDEDHHVAPAVRHALPQIAAAVALVAAGLRAGGRLVYMGAGTSGRLGVLDASECPPTFGTDPDQVVGLIAGGERALRRAVEGAEDSPGLGERDLRALPLTRRDTVVGLAASGATPYVIGGLDYARDLGAATVSVACNPASPLSAHAQVAIEVDNGPEVLTGSTRLKAGTSQKLVLNMISTGAMVQLGKVYGNLMVDLVPTNAKLARRAQSIVAAATGVDAATAATFSERAGGRPKTAIVMILADVDRDEAERRLARARGLVRGALAP